jgi:hypothetical protein
LVIESAPDVATVALTVAAVGASILFWAALEKARDPQMTVSTLQQLGFPAGLAKAAWLLILVELAVALGLVFRPDSIVTQGGVVVLAGTFASAGLLALRLEKRVRCTCFGLGAHGHLGLNQVAALIPWAGAAAFLNAADVASPSPSQGIGTLATIALTMATLRLVGLFGPWRQARGDRQSARETYVWLHP